MSVQSVVKKRPYEPSCVVAVGPSVLRAALQRAYDDKLWEWSGTITPAAVKTAESVVEAAGLLAADVPFGELVDLRFVGK